jgi:Ca-activated chloride channel family protein
MGRIPGLLLVLLAAVGAAATEDVLEVSIVTPLDGQPAIGRIPVAASVLSSARLDRLEVLVDDATAGVLTSPPWQLEVDLGLESSTHTVAVVATDVNGLQARAQVRTAPVSYSGSFSVSLQQLYVTALEGRDRVSGLEQHQFSVRDGGEPQEIVTFAAGDIPFTAALLIDVSSSMQGSRLDAAIAGVRSFVAGMGPLDQAAVLACADRLVARTEFTSDPSTIVAELGSFDASGGTALLDFLYLSLGLLEQRQGRRVVVILSDGIDSHSVLDADWVAERAARSQTQIYWIWLRRSPSREFTQGHLRNLYSTWRTADDYRRNIETVERMVERSGGRVVRIAHAEQVEHVFADIVDELREQYMLGYYPSNAGDDGSWRRVTVRVDAPGVSLRTHEGYVDY